MSRPVFTRRAVVGLGCALGFEAFMPAPTPSKAAEQGGLRTGISWAVFYGPKANIASLSRYDLVVLDAAFKGSVSDLTAGGVLTCGYVSLGEIAKSSVVYPLLKDQAVLIEENKAWPGTFRVDVRQPAWSSFILDQAIPLVLARGFNGLFFDTLDTPPYLEESDPVRYRGMASAAAALVAAIRRKYPHMPLVMNRGYALLPAVRDQIDAVVAESFLTTYDTGNHGYKWVGAKDLEAHDKVLKPARERAKPLPILSLDYWDPADTATIRKIYEAERTRGHSPYVATVALDALVDEPTI